MILIVLYAEPLVRELCYQVAEQGLGLVNIVRQTYHPADLDSLPVLRVPRALHYVVEHRR